MRYAQLDADVQENLRSKAVTTWFESAETRPGNNAKADTAAREMLVRCAPRSMPFFLLLWHLHSFYFAVRTDPGEALISGQTLDIFLPTTTHPTLLPTLFFFFMFFLLQHGGGLEDGIGRVGQGEKGASACPVCI